MFPVWLPLISAVLGFICTSQWKFRDTGLKLRIVLVFIAYLLMFGNAVAAPAARVAVIYPLTSGVMDAVFRDMMAGLASTPGMDLLYYQLTDSVSQAEFEAWLAARRVQGVVALGQKSAQYTQRMQSSLPVIYGAISSAPDGGRGISMTADPEQFFSLLNSMAPRVKRVYTIYNDANTGWILPYAREAASRNGLELVAYQARDSREAITLLRTLLPNIRHEVDSFWVQLDGMVTDRVGVTLALEAAWERRMVVISNNPLHVKRGALFSLQPDNVAMGRRLGDMMVQAMRTELRPLTLPSKALTLTINDRTAEHFGLMVNRAKLRDYVVETP